MKRMVLPLMAADGRFLLGFAATALAATDSMTSKGDVSAAGAAAASADSAGKTGETAECPIKKNSRREDLLLSE